MAVEKGAALMGENRKASRRRVLKSATIEFDRGAFSCAVRNLSEAGAALGIGIVIVVAISGFSAGWN
jgi:hypothetical protein